MQKLSEKLYRQDICDRCNNSFTRPRSRFVNRGSAVNLISHWTLGPLGKETVDGICKEYSLVCKSCLNDGYLNYRSNFLSIVPPKRAQEFRNYRYKGLI